MGSTGGGRQLSRRGFLAGAGGVAMTAALAACGSNTGRSGGSSLSQWYHQYGEAGTQQAAIANAKAYTEAKVSVQWTPGDYTSKLSSGLLGGNGPDTFENQLNVDAVRSKQIVALDDVIGDAKDDFTDACTELATVDGTFYGVPMVEDMQLLLYRKSMLDKANVEPPTSVDELIEAAKALTSKDVKGFFAGNDAGVATLGGPSLWSVGLDYVTADQKVGFDDPSAVTAVNRLRTLFTSGAMLLGAPADWSDPSAFTQGLTAMQWTGIWTLPAVAKALGDDVGVLPWPAGSERGKASVPIGTYNAMVSARSKDVDAAKAFVKWLWVEQTERQLAWAQDFGVHIPTRTSLITKADKLSDGLPAEAVKLSQAGAKPASPPSWTPKMSTAYADALSNIIRKGANPSSELKTAVGVASAELKRLYG